MTAHNLHVDGKGYTAAARTRYRYAQPVDMRCVDADTLAWNANAKCENSFVSNFSYIGQGEGER